MTPQELRTIGLAMYGADWKSPLARAVGVTPRQMRRYANEDSAVPDWLETKLGELAGALPARPATRDEWIVGEGEDERAYIVHARAPRFIARLLEAGDDAVDQLLDGDSFDAGDGLILVEIDWIDERPTDAAAARLLAEAAAQV